jgi:hypothetical protein
MSPQTSMVAEDFITSNEAVQRIGSIIIARDYHRGLLYDLGSCRGTFVFGILDVCPDLRVVGIDKSRLRTWCARLLSIFHNNRNHPTFLKADIFETDVSRIDVAFAYLPRPLMPALETKLQRELKPGSLLITYRVHLPSWQPSQVFQTDVHRPERNNIFVYQKN